MSAYQGGSQPVTLGVGAFVAVYPYEGGAYYINGGNSGLLGLVVQKDITQAYGTFSFTLSPGGPSGQSFPTWTQVLTPYSFVQIGVQRGNTQQIIMMGVVTSCAETQTWNPGQVQRATLVQGADLAYFFSNSNYYNLAYTAGLAQTGIGGIGQLSSLNDGLVGGTPAQLGKAWYTSVMAGNGGILSTVTFNKGNTTYPFSDVIQYWFQEYPFDLPIPNGANFLASQGTWLSKFLSFFNTPWYEFFVITAPQGYYPAATGPKNSELGALGQYASAQTFIVARVNPFPYAKNIGTIESPKWQVDASLWQGLPRNTGNQFGFLNSNVGFTSAMVSNFFLVNVVNSSQLFGGSQSDISAFVADGNAWVDRDSIARYGYLPEIPETEWFYDTGANAQTLAANGQAENFADLVNDLTYRVIAQYAPTPLMASGQATFPMMPDIMPGTVFTYVPFKDGVTWDFYVQGVAHSFAFGGLNTTTLTLTRGLPSNVYNDTSGMLLYILTATAMKQDGLYQKNPKAKGLSALTMANAGTDVSSYGTLQGGVQPS
jgi:hypothetical protein